MFILIGASVGGSALVYSSALQLAAGGTPQGVSVVDARVVASAYFATEYLTVFNDAQAPVPYFTVSSTPLPPAAEYCLSLLDPGNSSLISTTCPSSSPGASVVKVVHTLRPGGSVLVVLFISASPPPPGATLAVTVTSAGGALSSQRVQVVPA